MDMKIMVLVGYGFFAYTSRDIAAETEISSH